MQFESDLHLYIRKVLKQLLFELPQVHVTSLSTEFITFCSGEIA